MAVSAAFFCIVAELLAVAAVLGVRWSGAPWLLAGLAAAAVLSLYYRGLCALRDRLAR